MPHFTSSICSASRRFTAASILVLSIAISSPRGAVAQEKAGSRDALNLVQDAFVSIAEELEPAVVTVTAKKTVRARAARTGTDDGDDGIPGLPFGRSRTPRTFSAEGTGSGLIISTDGWI